jgi:hypothetical protein
MKAYVQKLLVFLKSTFSEPDGTGSASRVLAGASVISTILWVTYLVIKNGALPDLGGASLFLTSSFSGYAANQVTRMKKRDGDGDKKDGQ